MDKIGASFENCLESIEKRFAVNAKPIEWPIGAENEFDGIIDIINLKAYKYDGKPDETPVEIEIPEELRTTVEGKRVELIEAVAEFDDELMEKYLEGNEVSIDLIKRAIRKGVVSVQFFPILCGTALGNVGVKLLLDAIIDYLPSPADVEAITGTNLKEEEVLRHPKDEEPFTALAFKIMTDPFVGKLAFIRVYAGKLTSGSYVLNATKGSKERVGRLLQMHANHRQEISEVYAGDIVAIVGLKNTVTGDTLCDESIL